MDERSISKLTVALVPYGAFAVSTLTKPAIPVSQISLKPDVCGGDACIGGTRIPVWVLVNYRRLGGSDAEIFVDYPSLKMADLEAAWEYAAAHAAEIDRAIHENEEGEDGRAE